MLGACVAHSVTALLRYELLRRGKPDAPLSRLQVYYDAREAEGTTSEDAGCEIRDAIKAVGRNGAAAEFLWPYTPDSFAIRPALNVYAEAIRFVALKYERVAVGVATLKEALASGHPVAVGLDLYDCLDKPDAERHGVVRVPERDGALNGHCMYAVGYGQRPGCFTVRNHWGTGWGDKGDCYVPEAMLGSTKFGSDYWVIKAAGSGLTS